MSGKRYRNKKKERIKRSADNAYSALTGNIVIRLTQPCTCWVTPVTAYKGVRIKKIAYAAFAGWQPAEMSPNARRMKQLKVTQTCGNEYCVNPEHLRGVEKPFDLVSTWQVVQ